MRDFSTKRVVLFYSSTLDMEEQEKLDRFLRLLDKSGVAALFPEWTKEVDQNNGRPAYSPFNMLSTIIYGFAFRADTLRDLEEKCKYDIRYMYLMDQETPSHMSFSNFINRFLTPRIDEVFHTITKAILDECDLDTSEMFLDGSKFEADANKYKFVWKPTTWHTKLCRKIRILLEEYNLERNVPKDDIFPSSIIAEKLSAFSEIIKGNEENRKLRKDYDQLLSYLTKALEYEEKERICGENRNSYFKTDHDATAMCLKEDYYSGLGSNMHAAYNVQLLVSKGIICSYYVSQSRSDLYDLIPSVDRFYRYFNKYPARLCADAGYGSVINWKYLEDHKIENYVKYSSWEGNVSGRNPDRYVMNNDSTITCLNKCIGKKVEIPGRHPKKAGSVFYRVDNCEGCEFALYCKRWMKEKDGPDRIFEVPEELYKYKQEAEQNLLSIKGIEMRVNRSSQAEGAFGVLKQDMRYERFRRTTIQKVSAEMALECLGYNIRKLFRHYSGKAKFNYWSAPANLEPEAFKKPSAKRLSNRMKKKSEKSVNQKSKDSYKHK